MEILKGKLAKGLLTLVCVASNLVIFVQVMLYMFRKLESFGVSSAFGISFTVSAFLACVTMAIALSIADNIFSKQA